MRDIYETGPTVPGKTADVQFIDQKFKVSQVATFYTSPPAGETQNAIKQP